jgi:hypothetical protein
MARFEERDVAPPFEAEESTDDPAGRDVDEALEQMGSEGCRVCPLCGAIVASDGSCWADDHQARWRRRRTGEE